jgi:hypothetical protein
MKEFNDVSPYNVRAVITEELSTCLFMFRKVRHSDVSCHFSKTAPVFLEDFPSPSESSGPVLLRFIPLFSALLPR